VQVPAQPLLTAAPLVDEIVMVIPDLARPAGQRAGACATWGCLLSQRSVVSSDGSH
jgi:hypothetical protein